MEKPLRVTGIIICGVMLGLPALACFREEGASHATRVLHDMNVLFPVTFWALSRFFIDEGRARERAAREQADRGQRR